MFSQKKLTKSIIAVYDTFLLYVTLAKDDQGFFITQHERVDLPQGIIVRGEILKADLFYKIIKKIATTCENKNIDILLSHEYFLCADGILDDALKNIPLKKQVQEYFKNNANSEPWHKTHVCEFSTHTIHNKENVLFKCLPKGIQKSYIHVFKKSGFKVSSISSDILAFDQLLPKERTSLISVGAKNTRVAEFKSGMYVSHKTFEVSYGQFTKDIEKYINVSPMQARLILDQHGLLRSHKEEKVYTRLLRSISPLVDFLSKRKIKESLTIKIIFDEKPIPGLVDYISKSLRVDTSELDVIYTNEYVFQDMLSLHRDESYQYQALIAQALKSWKH